MTRPLLILAATASLLGVQSAARDPIIRKPLLDATLTSDKTVHQVKIVSIDFTPSQTTGTHIHPIPVVGFIAKGTITFEVEGEPPKTLKAGDAFFEPANVRIVHFDNASDREPASFVANYLLGPDDRELIKMVGK